jgi:hypothetical protein
MNILELLEKLINEHGSAAIKGEQIALLKEQFSVLKSESALLKGENLQLKTENVNLRLENKDLRSEINRRDQLNEQFQNSGFIENMGALWKHAKKGFEPNPYCRECSTHPVMRRLGLHGWQCSKGHIVPFESKPPEN